MMYEFDSLKSLQYTRGLTDAQLLEVSSKPSSCSAPKRFSYEDEFCSFLVQYLNLITGIEWRRAYEQSSRMQAQYGVVHLLSVNPTGFRKTERVSVGNDVCEVVSTGFDYDFQLDVYRDSGTKTGYTQPDAVTQPHASAIDVLSKVATRSQLLVFSSALSEYGISSRHFLTRINNVPQEVAQGVYEYHATMRPTLSVCMSQSIKVATVNKINLSDCAGLEIEQLPEDGDCG